MKSEHFVDAFLGPWCLVLSGLGYDLKVLVFMKITAKETRQYILIQFISCRDFFTHVFIIGVELRFACLRGTVIH